MNDEEIATIKSSKAIIIIRLVLAIIVIAVAKMI